MGIAPDFAGFEDAQVRLRANFGHDVEFFTPTPTTWPPGTPLDPESGVPYDPAIRPVASGFVSASARCNVVERGFAGGLAGDREQAALGAMTDFDLAVIVPSGAVAIASGATRVVYSGREFKIEDFRDDHLGPVLRYVAFCEER